ncbi:hypothetical protein BYT27DRAFT_7202476 [Phlegmacium glaucopus]|nr:hypothetical protein BYT27DRAFT_7202476 [Phlegmacium glaucopus]
MHSRLAVDTTIGMTAGPSSVKSPFRKRSDPPSNLAGPSNVVRRGRSNSNASTSSSLSIVSPAASSTNASTTSLTLPPARSRRHSRSEIPAIEEAVRLGPEYVLAMHDYFPQHQSATCLSFRAGQVIHVLNRDSSGWWDGELEGRRGWFPTNYVNAEITSLTEEESLGMQPSKRGHIYSPSTGSATSWATISSRNHTTQHDHGHDQSSDSLEDMDPYCPPIMIPLLHGLSLLQNAVQASRVTQFHCE